MTSARVVALTLGLVLAMTLGVDSASAASSTWRGSIPTANGTDSSGQASWQKSPPSVQLTVTTGTLKAGSCVTVFFDWASSTHYDARAVRDCRSNDTLTYTFSEPGSSTLSGQAGKHGLCYGPQDKRGSCVGTGSVLMDWTPWPDATRADPCAVSWVLRKADGTVVSFIDGHPTSPAERPDGTC